MKMFEFMQRLWKHRRVYMTRFSLVFGGGVFIHTLLALFFLLAGRPWLAALNGASLVCYTVLLHIFIKDPTGPYTPCLMYLDMILHACTYSLLLGGVTGAFCLVLILVPMVIRLSAPDHEPHMPAAAGIAIAFLSAYLCLICLKLGPLAPFEDPAYEKALFHSLYLLSALMLAVDSAVFILESVSSRSALSLHAGTDPLTGLSNRYGFHEDMTNIWGTRFCLVMGDIDDFKKVNDLYGHSAGDAVLTELSELLRSSVHPGDVLCR